MRIAHISDLHIRNFKYRSEYNEAFDDLYRKLKILKPDLVINTGDTVHSKLAVSPELFDDVANHCISICEIAPYWIVLGNHDLNLKNKNRTDAISPIVRALQGRTKRPLHLLPPNKVPISCEIGFTFWNYDIRDHDQVFKPHEHDINIGLFHGSISGCTTDIGFVMEDAEVEVKKFDVMDFVLLGDIHKQQSFRDGRMQYPGSLIQQNYGEELTKGFLLWEINSKTDFKVDFHEINAPGRFYTIKVPSTLDLSNITVPKSSRVRAIVEGELTPSRRIELEHKIREAFLPIEIIIPDSSGERAEMTAPDIDELVGSRDKLMRDHLKERGTKETDIDEIILLFRQYETLHVDSDGAPRGSTWTLNKISWDNMLNYGEGNIIDFTKLSGLVGIFAPNASGKSSIFDIMLESLFDKISKEVPRNIDLVNDNKDVGSMYVDFESNGQPYSIERSIERISYGQRKLAETKQWGKTTLDFSMVDESLNGTSRPETEKAIRQVIGSFEDFALTTMVTQNPIFGLPGGADLLNCRETDRRKILFRFLDLDAYEQIGNAAKDDLKEIMGKLKVDRNKLEEQSLDLLSKCSIHELAIADANRHINDLEKDLSQIRSSISIEKNVEETLAKREKLNKKIESAIDSSVGFHTRKRAIDQKFQKTISELVNIDATRPNAPNILLSDLVPELERVRSKLEGEYVDLTLNKMKLSQGRESLKTLDGIPCGNSFPTCKFIVNATNFISQKDIIETTIEQLKVNSDATFIERTNLENIMVVHTDITSWEQKKSELDLSLSKSQTDLANIDSKIALNSQEICNFEQQLDELGEVDDTSLAALKFAEKNVTDEISRERDLAGNHLKKLGAAQALEEQVRNNLNEYDGLKLQAQHYEALVDMCGKNGLPYRILSLILPIINSEISKILSGIVKFNVFFEEDADEQTVSLFIQYGDYKSRPLSLGSGAEKFIASLAIRVALLSVSSLPKTDILIIDEGFGKLDSEHLEALQRMFEYLKEAFNTVFIVSHVDFMRDIVDHSIEITSSDGYAHVEIV